MAFGLCLEVESFFFFQLLIVIIIFYFIKNFVYVLVSPEGDRDVVPNESWLRGRGFVIFGRLTMMGQAA